VTRAWTDANRNFVPDCDLLNPSAQDLRAGGGDLCGVLSNTSFGQNALTNNFGAGVLGGWGVRPSDWNLGVSIQQQLRPRSSVEVTYTRRWYNGFFVADNLSLQPADLTPFSIVAPVDARLPGGGGYEVPGLYDVVPGKSGQVDNLIAGSSGYGTCRFTQRRRRDGQRPVGRRFTLVGARAGQTVATAATSARLPELATTVTGTSAFGAGGIAPP
jgi:hypothetical protein